MSDVASTFELPLPADGVRIHVVGAGGAGMSAIAVVLAEQGYQVSGSDRVESATLSRLHNAGITTHVGHEVAHVDDATIVTISTAVPDDNPEVAGARASGIPVWTRADMLAALTRLRPTIAVAGTHGKTTTSSMLALALTEARLDPSFVIGAEVRGLGTGARWTADGEWFVVEADESDGTFMGLERRAGVVTSVEPDHIGHYGSVDALVDAFGRFVDETDGPVAVCVDDEGARRLAESATTDQVITYGTSTDAMARIVDHADARLSSFQRLVFEGVEYPLTLAVPGLHNARNATAAFAVAAAVGADPHDVLRGLERYAGVARRFELRGEVAGVTLVDDYAHLPTEIAATLDATAAGEWGRIVTVFQPHRYTRTADLHATFADAFVGSDLVIVTDIYSSGETPLPGVTGKLVADAVLDAHPWQPLAYLPHRDDVIGYLASRLRPGDLCLTLGAGDLTSVPDDLAAVLGERAS